MKNRGGNVVSAVRRGRFAAVAAAVLLAGGLLVSLPAPPTVSAAGTEALVPLDPARLLETRPGLKTVDGQAQGGGKVGARKVIELEVTGRGGVPGDAEAVMLNVTAVGPSGAGYLTVFPCGSDRPVASNVNYAAGDVVPNAVLAKVGAAGKVCIFSLAASDVLVDVNGYVPNGGSLKTVDPARLLETRQGLKTVDGQAQGGGPIGAGRVLQLKVTGRGGVPGSAEAVMLNVTAVGPSGAGYLTVFPCGSDRPVASNVNYSAGDVVPNAVLAKVGAGGKVCIFSLASSDVLVDVNGFVPQGGSLITVDPARLVETRASQRTIDDQGNTGRQIRADGFEGFLIVGRGPIPRSAEAVMLNVTVVGPAAPGFLTVYPCGSDRPLASNVNFGPGDVVPNAVLAKVGDDGKICIFSKAWTDVVVDVNGYVPTSAPPAVAPDCSASLASQAECDALTAIFNSMSGSIWRFPGAWGSAADPCTWQGVTCAANGVTSLVINSINQPSGPLPPEIGDLGNLTNLSTIGVSHVPPEIGGLTELTTIFLDGPYTSLPPQFGQLTKLKELFLRNNLMTKLPAEIGNLTNATRMSFTDSKLATLPPQFGNLDKLEILEMNTTPITSLPVEIGNLSSLQQLRMTFNDLQGDITAPFAALRAGAPSLTSLSLTTTSTCPIVTDPSLVTWLDSFNSFWDFGCP